MFAWTAANETLEAARQRMVDAALIEDLGTGDWTANLVPDAPATAQVVVKQAGAVLCGQAWFAACVHALDPHARLNWHIAEGETMALGACVCTIQAQSRALLTAERPALNFLQTLSSTATETRALVAAIKGCSPNPQGCAILDTRKTLPGLRLAQKYAVRVGGGVNQRLALWHGMLIKENHIAACGSIGAALQAAQKLLTAHGKLNEVSVQIEVETLEELAEALRHGARSILLDDFSVAQLTAAVQLNRDHAAPAQQACALLEASGGITLDNIRDIAKTGVDRISIGKITKDVTAVDFSLRFAAH